MTSDRLLAVQGRSKAMGIERLSYYASHVKTLVWNYHCQCDVSKYSIDEFQDWLSRAAPSGFTLLRGVRTVEFTEDDEYYGVLYHFLAPALEELRINAGALAIEPILRHLDRSCPHLKSVHLTSPSSGHHYPPPAFDDLALAPLSMMCLARFTSSGPLTLGAVVALSHISSLRHLSVAVSIKSSQVFPPVASPFFDTLETCRISAHRLNETTVAFVRAISSFRLTHFTLAVQATSNTRFNERIVMQHTIALSQAPFKDTLRSVAIFLKHTSPSVPTATIGVSVIQPILSCCSLDSLEVFADTAVLDLAACRYIASAFSHLEVLAFSDNSPSDRRDQGVGIWAPMPYQFARAAPLEGLLAITKACRRLRSLHIPIRIETLDQLVLDDAAVLPTIEHGIIIPRYKEKNVELEQLVDAYLGKLLPRWPRPSQVTSIIPRTR